MPAVSASSTSRPKASWSRPVYSAMITGRSAAAIMSAAFASAAGSGPRREGTFTASGGGSFTSCSSFCSCSHAS
jgi:hypothetical protein